MQSEESASKDFIEVVCALIESPEGAEGRVLCALRGQGMALSGHWEFPGGKCEPGESHAEALVREIREELNLLVEPLEALHPTETLLENGRMLRLWPYRCRWIEGTLHLLEHAEVRWVDAAQLAALRWAPADLPIVEDWRARFEQRWV
ncbi:NUDIX domain-containing protein [bacterium]|nr:NUDIX domain-containing protein [bacterium]